MLDSKHPMHRRLAVVGLTLSLFFPSSFLHAEGEANTAYPRYEDNSVERDLGKPIETEEARPYIDLGMPTQEAPPMREPVSDYVPSAVATPAPEAVVIPEDVTEPAREPAQVPDVVTKPAATVPQFKKYKVWIWQENGDCLWRIAEKVYGDRSKWKIIYMANRDIIKDPNKVYPKQKLTIPPPDWQP